ncbi:hypothetical protein KYC5002_30350 [Archangium violaceum]|uniref:hypothetical protein n=1 Tax=Archangium violaceum TaxID=83451 RepID=UPI002B325533|nr:hypothetical protein KYC5002_30350 [Archangium gephyra]
MDFRLGGELRMGRLIGDTPEQLGISPQLEGVLGAPGTTRLRLATVLYFMLVHQQPDPRELVISPAARFGLEVPWGAFSVLPYGVAGPAWNFAPGAAHLGSRVGVGVSLLWADAFRLTFEWSNEKYESRDAPRGLLSIGMGLDASLSH